MLAEASLIASAVSLAHIAVPSLAQVAGLVSAVEQLADSALDVAAHEAVTNDGNHVGVELLPVLDFQRRSQDVSQRSATVCTGVRLCTGAALAAVSALVLLAPELPGAVAVGYKIFTGCAVVAAAYGLPGRGRFARLCAWYALLNLLLCGAVVLPGVQSRNLSVSLPLSPGRLLASCAGVYAVLRALLYCFGRSGAPSVPATLEVAGVQLPVQAFHDTGFALQEPLSGKAVVLVQYPAVRHRLPQAARQYLDGWFAHSTAPPPPELGVHLVPCRSIHGQSMLPALPAALQLGKDRAGGLLAAFCCPTPPDPAWELLYGEDAAQLLL